MRYIIMDESQITIFTPENPDKFIPGSLVSSFNRHFIVCEHQGTGQKFLFDIANNGILYMQDIFYNTEFNEEINVKNIQLIIKKT
jgi:hypothetical protein